MKESNVVHFTIGKIDAGMGVLLTEDHHVVEMPSLLLPKGSRAGTIIKMILEPDKEKEKSLRHEFEELQKEIIEEFGKDPQKPVIRATFISQNMVIIEYSGMELNGSELLKVKGCNSADDTELESYMINSDKIKICGLESMREYKIHLVIKTTSGKMKTDSIILNTLTLDDFKGLKVCLNDENYNEKTIEDLTAELKKIGAGQSKAMNQEVTHFVTDVCVGDKFTRALKYNIPVVSKDWVKACVDQLKVVSTDSYLMSNAASIGLSASQDLAIS